VVIGGKGFSSAGRRPEVGWIGSERVGDFAWERPGESEVGKNHLEPNSSEHGMDKPNTEDAKHDNRFGEWNRGQNRGQADICDY